MNRELVLGRLDLVEKSLKVAREHAQILRWSVEADDVEGITRGRLGLHNALDLVHQLVEEVDAEMPDWRPLPEHTAQADGVGDFTNALPVPPSPPCGSTHSVPAIWPSPTQFPPSSDGHLGAVEE